MSMQQPVQSLSQPMMQQMPPQGYNQMPGASMNPQMNQQMFQQNLFAQQFQNLNVGGHKSYDQIREEKNKYPSLYVSNLPKESFFDLDFYKFFTSRGYRLMKAKVAIHKRTSKPLGYGYLQFYQQEEADRCLSEMNNVTLQGQPLRIVHSQAKAKYDEQANLLVKNIDKEVTQQELFDLFRQHGEIVSLKLETYQDGKSKGYAYIQFKTREEAEKAKDELKGHELRGKKIEIDTHEKRDKREPQTAKFNNLFVKNLPKGTDDDSLRQMFESYGEIESVYVQRGDGQELKDYGYVCFKDPENAEKALEGMNKKKVGDEFLIVNRHISKKDSEPAHGNKLNPITQNLTKTFNSNIYVKFIPSDVTEEQLREKFTIKGYEIISIKLTKWIKKVDGEETSPYQFAYILYNEVAAAQKAIQTFDQSTVFGPRPLLVELWVSKEEKEQERKKRDSQQISQFLSNMLNRTNSYPPMGGVQGGMMPGQQPGGMIGPGPYGGRGGYNNNRGGAYRGRGGNYRGGHRGGHQGAPGHQYQPRPNMPPHMGAGQGFQQYPQPGFSQPMQQPYGMVQPGFNPAMQVPVPQIQIPQLAPPDVEAANQLPTIKDPNERRQFVGNAIFASIEGVYRENAGKITGMLLDETIVDFNQLLTNTQYLSNKAREAMALIQATQIPQNQAPQ